MEKTDENYIKNRKIIENLPDDKKQKSELPKWLMTIRFFISLIWIVFQIYIIIYPLAPMVQRPLHVVFGVSLIFLFKPLKGTGLKKHIFSFIDLSCVIIPLIIGIYFIYNSIRIQSRIVFIDPIFPLDKIFCVFLVVLLIEAIRRTVGISLLSVVVAFLLYGWISYIFPGWLKFEGIKFNEYVELLFLGDSGIFGIPVETSLRYVFYFVVFGAIYSAIGGSKLLVGIGLRLTQGQKGGPAKAAVIASSLMGTVSGSAVANVAATGVFTIPLMKQDGYDKETAGATEAIASTGGQLMPPIMGIGAFIMAELLGVPYLRIALAGVIPALLFYISLFLLIDFRARVEGKRTTRVFSQENSPKKLMHFAHLFIPLFVIVFYIIRGYSPTMAAFYGSIAGIVVSFFRKETRLDFSKLIQMINSIGQQAASIVIPIASIGIIVGVAIQSNLALKFSSRLLQISGGSLTLSLIFIIMGCIILGMGLPTVAAYILSAVFFVPPLIKFGAIPLAAHFFVFYYSVLAMVTPPVALASFTAAGLAGGNVNKTGIKAFLMSLVAFMIPFSFLFKSALLWEGEINYILVTTLYTLIGVIIWTASICGYIGIKLSIPIRLFLGFLAIIIMIPKNMMVNLLAVGFSILVLLYIFVVNPWLKRIINKKS